MPTSSRSDVGGIACAGRDGRRCAAFAVLATLNAGGYRYGVSDQAFYIPAILHHLDPSLYPRDWAMIGAQGRYFLFDELFAGRGRRHRRSRCRGCSWPRRALTLAALFGGAWWLGRAVLAIAVGDGGVDRRADAAPPHRPDRRQHARGLLPSARARVRRSDWSAWRCCCAAGPWWALALAAASAALHPTTAACFVVIVGDGDRS